MQFGSWLAIYFIAWWISLFMVLPFGQRSQTDAGVITPGTDPGAPAVFRIWKKLLATTILAGVLMALIMWLLANPVLQRYWS